MYSVCSKSISNYGMDDEEAKNNCHLLIGARGPLITYFKI